VVQPAVLVDGRAQTRPARRPGRLAAGRRALG
jgi:hypothetical protein